MKYFSTFTGIGGIDLGLIQAFHDCPYMDKTHLECVGWSEIDKHAIATFTKNFPEIANRNYGDISKLNPQDLPDFDILIGGSSCQDLSIAKSNRKGLEGEKSKVFWDFVNILKVKKPKYFLLENVASMSKKDRNIISEVLGVEPVMICSDHFTPQKRKRLYWCNWEVAQPTFEGPRLNNLIAWSRSTRYSKEGKSRVEERSTTDGRANTLTTGKGCGSFSSKNYIKISNTEKRELTPEECEKLQSFPKGWTDGVSKSQRYKQIGNAVTVEVVKWIFRNMLNQRG